MERLTASLDSFWDSLVPLWRHLEPALERVGFQARLDPLQRLDAIDQTAGLDA